MITRVHLTNWKAYEELDIEIGEGTTFVVAANGVGKTSFIEAVRWALDPSGRPGDHVMRRRALNASVRVELTAGTARVVVTRTLDRTSATATPTVGGSATVDGVPTSIEDALDRLATEWSADATFIHRAAFLVDKALVAEKEPQLEEQLVRLYSLDNLRKTRAEILPVSKALEEEARALKRGAKATATELTESMHRAEEASNAVSAAEQLVASLGEAASTARAAVEAAERTATAARIAEQWAADMAELRSEVDGLLGLASASADLAQLLSDAEAGAKAQLHLDIERRAALTERLAALETSLQRLRASAGECPLCRRALDEEGRDHAAHAHERDIAVVSDELQTIEPEPSSSILDELGSLYRRVTQLGPEPPAPSEPVVDLEAMREVALRAENAWSDARAAAAVAASKATDAHALVDELASARDEPDAAAIYEQLALLEASDSALAATIQEVLEAQLGPLSDQVNRRWEALFPDRPGLRLDSKGTIRRTFDDDGGDLPSSAFSAGEKVIANILMRLTTISATTRIPFLWIDEPLEHLDPIARAYVAETLGLLPAVDGFAQILVTTYEEGLARQLEEREGHTVRLQFLEAAPPR